MLVALQRVWKDELGIAVTLTNMEWGVFLDKLDSRDFQGSRLGWVGGFLDPTMFLDLAVSDKFSNFTNFYSHRYDELVQTLAPDTPDRKLALLY